MSKKTWDLEYDCPQYVDFATDLDKSLEQDEVFFDCGEYSAPMQKQASESKVIDSNSTGVTDEPKIQVDDLTGVTDGPKIQVDDLTGVTDGPKIQVDGLAPVKTSETFEDFLVSKMMAGLASIKNAPEAARIRQQEMEKTPVPRPAWNATPKICDKETTGCESKIRRSKSITDLQKIVTKPAISKGLRKRSSSLNDLRPIIKKTNPSTPMCLKRAISKTRKVIKSTEQMELEEIARLQQQMKQHLRANELSLKRLNLKPRQGTRQKSTLSRPLKVNHAGGVNPPTNRKTCAFTEKRINLPELSKDVLNKRALDADAVVKQHMPRITEHFLHLNMGSQMKPPVESTIKENSKMQQKSALHKKIGFHSGLRFHETVKKTTRVQPFNFCTMSKELKAQANGVGCRVKVNEMESGKENVPLKDARPFCVKSNKGNINHEEKAKFFESLKKISEKRRAARQRGLSENIARN